MKNFLLSLFLVLACAAPAVFAKPPQPLVVHWASLQVVHDKTCNVASMQIVERECLILNDAKHDMFWVILFDDKIEITHAIAVKNRQEELVWCRPDVCL
jgi:hypothetical protein